MVNQQDAGRCLPVKKSLGCDNVREERREFDAGAYRLLAEIGATVLLQAGEPSCGLVPHQVGDRGELTAVRAVQLLCEPCRLVIAPELGNELQEDLLLAAFPAACLAEF